MGRTRQEDLRSHHLLSGLMTFGLSGGSIRVKTQIRGGKGEEHPTRWYVCSTFKTRGIAGCQNRIRVSQDVMEKSVLAAGQAALEPAPVERWLDDFLTERREQDRQRDSRRLGLEAQIAECGRRIGNLVEAVTRGDAPEPLLEALRSERDRQKALQAELETIKPQPKLWVLHEEEYRKAARRRVDDVLTLLNPATGIKVGPARTMLRHALEGPIVCIPEGHGFSFKAPMSLRTITGEAASRKGDSRRETSTCRGRG